MRIELAIDSNQPLTVKLADFFKFIYWAWGGLRKKMGLENKKQLSLLFPFFRCHDNRLLNKDRTVP